MKTRNVKRLGKCIAFAVLLAGLAYSGLALTAEPVYAFTCDCVEARQDANEICAVSGSKVTSFSCFPEGPAIFYVTCDGGNQIEVPCLY